MRNSLFSLLFLGTIISSCASDEIAVSKTASEWVVIGNDLGFRNEFIDMANVVRLSDSILTVHSVAYPDVALKFPIRDSTVIGSQDKHWQLTTVGPDTLLLLDTVQDNRYHLLRLKDYKPKADIWAMLTGSRFVDRQYYNEQTLVFEGSDTTGKNCYVHHRIQTWRGERRSARMKDGFWRLDQRFSQPILLYTLGQGEHYVTLIDSVAQESGLQGQLLINSRPNPQIHQRDTLRPIRDTIDMAQVRQDIVKLDYARAEVNPAIDPEKDSRWRVSWNGSELKEVLSVNDFEVSDLRLFLSGDNYALTTLGGELASGKFTIHPKYPYLILDGNCANDFYLPLAYNSDNELEVTLPIRIRLPDQEIKPMEIGPEQPNRVAYSENTVVFTIPFFRERIN